MKTNEDIYYYSQDGKLVCEQIESFYILNFLYKNRMGRLFRYFFNNRFAARLSGIYQDSRFSKKNILPFIKKHKIDTSEFLNKVSDFKSFNDFFIRKLKHDARKINFDENLLVSPADSKLFVIPEVSRETNFFVKNKKFNLKQFLKEDKLAKEYEDGAMMLFRLAPYDYHRFHFPVDCLASKSKNINGILESVNPIVYKSGIQPLTENERQVIILKNTVFGEIIVVLIGAMFVGKIVQTYLPDKNYKKGEEVGYFEFGGSSIVILVKKDALKIKENFVKNSQEGFETEVKMGQSINEF